MPTIVQHVQDGKIHSLVAQKGFGFIKPADGGADVFFHCSVVDAPFEMLVQGQEVKYESDVTGDKPRALRVETRGASAAQRSYQPRTRPGASAGARDIGRAADRQSYEYGFVTKLQRNNFRGFISSVRHGPEYLFAAESVTGERRFSRLEIGDYVQFLVAEPDLADPKQPVAKAVKVIKREGKIHDEKQLGRHPKARKKKPTWRR